jgi:hypothetical protein
VLHITDGTNNAARNTLRTTRPSARCRAGARSSSSRTEAPLATHRWSSQPPAGRAILRPTRSRSCWAEAWYGWPSRARTRSSRSPSHSHESCLDRRDVNNGPAAGGPLRPACP